MLCGDKISKQELLIPPAPTRCLVLVAGVELALPVPDWARPVSTSVGIYAEEGRGRTCDLTWGIM